MTPPDDTTTARGLMRYLNPLFLLGLSLTLFAFFVLPYTSAGTAARLTVILNPDHTITLDPENGKLFAELSADPENLLAPGVTVERRLAIRNRGSNEAMFTLRIKVLNGKEFLNSLTFKASALSDGSILYQGPLVDADIPLGRVEAKRERLFTLSVVMPADLGNEFQDRTGHADFVFTSCEAGDGTNGNDRLLSPPVDNIPYGVFIARWPGHMPLLDAPVMVKNPVAEFSVQVPDQTRLQEARAKGLEPRVYIWNERYGKWVALASYLQEDGKVKAINDGGYTGWAMVFAVRQPRFTDLRPGDWYESVLNRVNGMALIEGSPVDLRNPGSLGRLARPQAVMTRAEFAAMVTRALGLVVEEEQRMYDILKPVAVENVTDVLRGRYSDAHEIPGWCRGAVATAANSGLLDGAGGMETEFGPSVPISRVQAAVIISNALARVPGYDFKPVDGATFTDGGQIPSWAEGKVAQGVLSGNGDGSLKPNDPLTRAETYTLFLRLLRELGW